jgi:hypothetical protein
VATRGALLPEDERLLAGQWPLVERSVFEIEQVRPGEGCTVRDIRTGDVHQVRERTGSRQLKPGALICARVVPVGETEQIFGGIEPVALHKRDELIALLDSAPDPETLISFPAQAEQAGHPRVVRGGTAAPQLVLQPDDFDSAAQRLGGSRDFAQRAHFAGSHGLVLVQQEDRHVRDVDQFVDLPVGSFSLFFPGVLVDALFADAMSFVADQNVQVTRLTLHVGVEVLEQAFCARTAVPGVPAHRLGEGFRSDGVLDRETAPGQLAEEAQGDDTLARARAAFDDHDSVRPGGPRAFDRLHHELVGHSLLVQQYELLAVLDLGGRMGQQRLGRPVNETEELVSGEPAGCGVAGHVEHRAKVVGKLGPVVHGEQPAMSAGRVLCQGGYVRAPGVVQIGHTVNGTRPADQRGGVVCEVLTVTAYLLGRVKEMSGETPDVDHLGQVELGFRPLLELNEHKTALVGAGMSSAEHHVDPLLAVGKLVLQKNLHLAEFGVDEIAEQNRQALPPGVHFAEPRTRAEDVAGLLAKAEV